MTVKTVSRGSGSAKARSEYIDREGKYKKDCDEVLYKASGNMPEWANESRQYWEAADIYERENGRLFKQLEFALPNELNPDEQKELVKSFVEKLTATADEKLPYSYSIHKGHDRENPHCHLMISERIQDKYIRSAETWFKRANSKEPNKGGAKKSTALMPKEWLENTRESWSIEANKALKLAGHKTRIDHRTLGEQGLNRQPTKHRGPALNAMLMTGKLTQEEIEKDLSNPTDIKKKENELAEAKHLKESINLGIAVARQDFVDEKKRLLLEQREIEEKLKHERQLQEIEKQKELDKQRQEKELLQEKENQRKLQLQRKQKSRGMGFGR
ncbi:MAG: MobA/MobL family protein [Lactococcus garvieae]